MTQPLLSFLALISVPRFSSGPFSTLLHRYTVSHSYGVSMAHLRSETSTMKAMRASSSPSMVISHALLMGAGASAVIC